MSCRQGCEGRLLEWVEGGLAGRRQRRFARHLESCPDCRRELAALQALRGELARYLDPVGSPPQLSDESFARIVIARAETRPAAPRRAWNWGLAAAAGAAAVLALLTLLPDGPGLPTGGPQLSRLVLASPYADELLAEVEGDAVGSPAEEIAGLASGIETEELAGLATARLPAGDLIEALESAAADGLLYPSEEQVIEDLRPEEISPFFDLLKEA